MEIQKNDLQKIGEFIWEIPKTFQKAMQVPAKIYASEKLLVKMFDDRTLGQLVNVAAMPGAYKNVVLLPDGHEGYGNPIGGVLATDVDKDGIISPGICGYDIKCSVGLFFSQVTVDKIKDNISNLIEQFFQKVPSGLGIRGPIKISSNEYYQVLEKGAHWAVSRGFGKKEDLKNMEDEGVMAGADAQAVSPRAKKRGEDELGTLGSGNHFLEIQMVEKIFDEEIAKKWGLFEKQLTIMLHSGSRGLGHQVCTDYINVCRQTMVKYKIVLPDPELACVPFGSPEGQNYFGAMAAAANYAYANHQILSHFMREVWPYGDLKLLYHMGHNIARVEEYDGRKLCVHRKGATRCIEGEPVLIPGSMGTASYILVGQKSAQDSFNSCAHGAGRVMSRAAAKRQVWGEDLKRQLEQKGIFPRTRSMAGLAEEAPLAYKDIDEVVRVIDKVGLAKKVARLVPLGVIKG